MWGEPGLSFPVWEEEGSGDWCGSHCPGRQEPLAGEGLLSVFQAPQAGPTWATSFLKFSNFYDYRY